MIKINLLPGKGKKDLLKLDLCVFLAIVLINLVVLGSIYYMNAKDIANYNKKIENAKKEVASLQHIYNEYQSMEQEKKEIQRRIKAINSIKEGRALSARILYDLASTVTENVWIKSFRKTEGKFELDGRSMENESISNFVESISKIPYVKNVELRNVENVLEEGVTVKRFVIAGDMTL